MKKYLYGIIDSRHLTGYEVRVFNDTPEVRNFCKSSFLGPQDNNIQKECNMNLSKKGLVSLEEVEKYVNGLNMNYEMINLAQLPQ